jgi:hypothetical protein
MIASKNEMWMDKDGSIRVNGTVLGQGTTSQLYTNNLTSGYSTGGDTTFVMKKDYYTDCADYGITIDTEYIENVCRKIWGKTDICKEKDEVDDVIVPPMKGFIEI